MNNTTTQDTLLIVDDIQANIKMLADFLKSVGLGSHEQHW
jgi:CheY-like chemotaxis protein